MKTIIRTLTNAMLVVSLLIGFTACGQTEKNVANEIKEVKVKSDFASEHCKARLEEGIGQEKGVKSVDANLTNQIVTIQYQSDKNTGEALAESVKKLGYASSVICDKGVNAKCPKDGKACTKEDSAKCCKQMQKDCKAAPAETKEACKPGTEKPCCKKK